jgi:hypothetical protein
MFKIGSKVRVLRRSDGSLANPGEIHIIQNFASGVIESSDDLEWAILRDNFTQLKDLTLLIPKLNSNIRIL